MYLPEPKVNALVALGEGVPLLDFDVPEVPPPQVCEVVVVHSWRKAVGELVVNVLLVPKNRVWDKHHTTLLGCFKWVLHLHVGQGFPESVTEPRKKVVLGYITRQGKGYIR